MEQYTFNKDQIEAIMYGYASHIAAYDTKVISALDWLSKYGPATTPPPAKAEQEGYKTFEEKSIKWYRENYGKEFPYKLCKWMFNELSTTPVKEAGQPSESEKDFEDLLEAELNKLPYTKHVDDGQYNDGQCAGFELGARWAQSRQQPAGESAGVWVPFTKDARLPKNEDFLVKYDTGEIRRYQEEEQPFGIVTHYMILNDESGASTKEREIAFAEWIQRKWIPTYENNKLHSWRFFGPHDHEWYGKDYTTSQIYDLWQQSL